MPDTISIIMPVCNESESLRAILPVLVERFPDAEIIVVNDGSTDHTGEVCRGHDVTLVEHPYNKGNGAAVKSGARAASGDILVFMDADGQHSPEDIPRLLERIDQGYDMAVGARDDEGQANRARMLGNRFYNWLATRISGQPVADLTSGFRAVRADYFRRFLYLLPNGFSYPTTITMAFFRAGFSIAYLPIAVKPRTGKSHLRLVRDGIRFLLIIFKIGTLYSPLKIFVPASLLFFFTGVGYYGYTYITMSRFTNMSALLFISAILVFLIGLVSEQITTLMYSDAERSRAGEE